MLIWLVRCAEYPFKLNDCNSAGNFDIEENQWSITCTGLNNLLDIYWSISGPATGGVEVRLGTCPACDEWCPHCLTSDSVSDSVRRITRTQSETTLYFSNIGVLSRYHGVTIKCSSSNNQSSDSCRLKNGRRCSVCILQ